MSSKKLADPIELDAHHGHKAYIRIFKYTPLTQYDHLLCLDGDPAQGTIHEQS